MQNMDVEVPGLRSAVSMAGEICGSSGVQPLIRGAAERASSLLAIYVNSTKNAITGT
jgi:hypothetical protein